MEARRNLEWMEDRKRLNRERIGHIDASTRPDLRDLSLNSREDEILEESRKWVDQRYGSLYARALDDTVSLLVEAENNEGGLASGRLASSSRARRL